MIAGEEQVILGIVVAEAARLWGMRTVEEAHLGVPVQEVEQVPGIAGALHPAGLLQEAQKKSASSTRKKSGQGSGRRGR